MYERNFSADGFEWIDTTDRENSVVTYSRKGNNPADTLLIVLNMTPVPRQNYRIGVPAAGSYQEVFNSDATEFYGSGVSNTSPIASEAEMWHGRPQSIQLNVPPLGAVVLKMAQN